MAGITAIFPSGFSTGQAGQVALALRNMPLLQTQPGAVFWLNNGTVLNPQARAGSDSNRGTFLSPFATLAHAMSVCVAGRGDIIMIAPGHKETITANDSTTFTVAGVSVVGLGSGSNRPTFTLSTATTASWYVNASNISIQNIIFIANVTNLGTFFGVGTSSPATDFTLDNCEFRDASSTLYSRIIVNSSATAGSMNGLTISNCTWRGAYTGSNSQNLVIVSNTADRISIINNNIITLTTSATALIPATAVMTNFLLLNNLFNLQNATGTATGYIITTNQTTNTGFIHGNYDHALPTTPLFCTASSGFVYGANYHSDQADLQGYLVPAADS